MKAYYAKIPIPNTNKELECIFEMQEKLMDEYIFRRIEPPHFKDLNNTEAQNWLKSTLAKVVEELAEADENYRELALGWDKETQKKLLPYLIDFNEEIGDVMHYLIEFMQYSYIGADDIKGYYKKMLKERDLEVFYFEDNLLKTCLAYARHCNTQNENYLMAFTLPAFQLSELGIENDPFLRGGSKITPELEFAFHNQMWDFVYFLMRAGNCLKIRPWKKEVPKVDMEKYQLTIMEAWLHFMRLLDIMNFDCLSLLTVYVKKNAINHQRLTLPNVQTNSN